MTKRTNVADIGFASHSLALMAPLESDLIAATNRL